MMSRYKPVGWRYESYRHYLAGKGVATSRYFAPRKGQGRSWSKAERVEMSERMREYARDPAEHYRQKFEEHPVDKSGFYPVDVVWQEALVDRAERDRAQKEKIAAAIEEFQSTPEWRRLQRRRKDLDDADDVLEGKGLPGLRDRGYYAAKSDTYARWRKLVNMSPSELERFKGSDQGKIAGLSRREASSMGIHSGRDSAAAIIRMKRKPRSEWTSADEAWMNRQVSFVSRMKGNPGPLYDEKGRPTRKLLALKIWGHNPEKR